MMVDITKTGSKVNNNNRERLWKRARKLVLLLGAIVFILIGTQDVAPVQAIDTRDVTVILHEARSITNADGGGGDDIYWKVKFTTALGEDSGDSCDSFDQHIDGRTHIFPEWKCSFPVEGGDPFSLVQIDVQLWEHDGTVFTGPDDHFDIRPAGMPSPGFDSRDIRIFFKPLTNEIRVVGDDRGLDTFQCAPGRLRFKGDSGEDQAEVVFSVSAALSEGGDSDLDGLYDSWEQCGVDSDNDRVVDVDLPALGADLFRKDLFVEVDWFIDNDPGGLGDHSHEPWLPSLINAWNEFNVAPITNPNRSDGTPSQNGIALHVDTGQLYADYTLDVSVPPDGTAEYVVGPSGNFDVTDDGITDIGNLGGGNRICNDLTAPVLGLCGAPGEGPVPLTQSDATSAKRNNFSPGRAGIFRYAIFTHSVNFRDPSCDTTGGVAPWGEVDFVVSLPSFLRPPCGRGWPREPMFLATQSPSGSPVDGTRILHTATFLHELGHSLGLGHGGGDGINRKPNYLSIMNYNYACSPACGIQFDFSRPPDLIPDPIPGADFDMDGNTDGARFFYSDRILPAGTGALVENMLNEPIGIGDTRPTITFFGPVVDANGDGSFDVDGDGICDGPVSGGMFGDICVRTALGNAPIDWSRGDNDGDGVLNNDGDRIPPTDVPINSLTSPPNPPGILTDINQDNVLNDSDEPLSGFNDYRSIQFGGLVPPRAGLTKEEVDRSRRVVQRARAVPDERFIEERCDDLRRITFEEFPVGSIIENQYAPPVHFLRDPDRSPTIVGSAERDGLPTQSPTQSLVNLPPLGANEQPSLVIDFSPPQKFVGLYGGVTRPSGEIPNDLAILTAFDTEGFPLGEVREYLPVYPEGITGFMGLAAIFNDQLISRIELRHDLAALTLPVHIDDLIVCEQQTLPIEVPVEPPTVTFGDVSVTVNVEAKVISEGGVADADPRDSEHRRLVEAPLTGVPITADSIAHATNFSLSKKEGESVTLVAPMTFDTAGGDLTFSHWLLHDSVFFPDGMNEISPTLLRDATFTAVYTREKGNHTIYLPLIMKYYFPMSDLPPTVLITNPATDTGPNDNEYVFDGFDEALGLWYNDVLLEGVATDPEDGILSGASLVWTTNRTDLQDATLGTGSNITVRLYSDDCSGATHEITLTARDSDGNTGTDVRRITIWTLC